MVLKHGSLLGYLLWKVYLNKNYCLIKRLKSKMNNIEKIYETQPLKKNSLENLKVIFF